VRACHERFDGTGYPDGLAGEAIPIESRIIFVCDAFHAMTTDRPYRRALSVEVARAELEEGAGAQFDPEVVEACLRILDQTSAS
jgi:HD-GYP domain-containing protein (c-di-GMP phosphodiesterase class II)